MLQLKITLITVIVWAFTSLILVNIPNPVCNAIGAVGLGIWLMSIVGYVIYSIITLQY